MCGVKALDKEFLTLYMKQVIVTFAHYSSLNVDLELGCFGVVKLPCMLA